MKNLTRTLKKEEIPPTKTNGSNGPATSDLISQIYAEFIDTLDVKIKKSDSVPTIFHYSGNNADIATSIEIINYIIKTSYRSDIIINEEDQACFHDNNFAKKPIPVIDMEKFKKSILTIVIITVHLIFLRYSIQKLLENTPMFFWPSATTTLLRLVISVRKSWIRAK